MEKAMTSHIQHVDMALAIRIDALVCNWSMLSGQSFTEEKLNSLVDTLAAGLRPKTGEITITRATVSSLLDVLEDYRLDVLEHRSAMRSRELDKAVDALLSEMLPEGSEVGE